MKGIFSVLVENKDGVLSQISGLFARRGYNIDSLAVGETDKRDISSMTITGDDDDKFSILSCTVGGASDMTPSLTKGGDPAVVTIQFTKESGMGTYHAILNIASNSTTDAAFEVFIDFCHLS